MRNIIKTRTATYWAKRLSFLPDPPFTKEQERKEHLKAISLTIILAAIIGILLAFGF
jgi:hypothetical protein